MAEPLVESQLELQAVRTDEPSAKPGAQQDHSAKLRVEWGKLCRGLCVDASVEERWWVKIFDAYSEPWRKYCTFRQLAECHEHFHQHTGSMEDPNAVHLAIFFSNFVHDPVKGSPTNQQESAIQADLFCQEALPPGDPVGKDKGDFIVKVMRWIEGYSRFQANDIWHMDGKYYMDIMVAICGAPWERYQEHSEQIAAEFNHLPEVMVIEGRISFLETLRSRALRSSCRSMFSTTPFRSSHGPQAMENTKREVEMLSERGKRFGCCSRACAKWWSFIWIRNGKYGIIVVLLFLLALLFPLLWLVPALLFGFALVYGTLKLGCCMASYTMYPYPLPSSRSKITVVIAGSYNPPHMGHLEMIRHLSQANEKVVAVVGINPEKVYSVSPYQRQELMRAMVSELGLANVQVVVWGGTIFRYAKSIGASRMYRGIRTWKLDGRGEKWLEFLNMTVPFLYWMWPIPTSYLQGAPHLSDVSSSLLRRRLADEEDISDLVPPGCCELVKQAYIPGTFVVEDTPRRSEAVASATTMQV